MTQLHVIQESVSAFDRIPLSIKPGHLKHKWLNYRFRFDSMYYTKIILDYFRLF